MSENWRRLLGPDGLPDPDHAEVLEPTEDAVKDFGFGYGATLTVLSQADVELLVFGKLLAFSDGEYHHFLVYAPDDNQGSKPG